MIMSVERTDEIWIVGDKSMTFTQHGCLCLGHILREILEALLVAITHVNQGSRRTCFVIYANKGCDDCCRYYLC